MIPVARDPVKLNSTRRSTEGGAREITSTF